MNHFIGNKQYDNAVISNFFNLSETNRPEQKTRQKFFVRNESVLKNT